MKKPSPARQPGELTVASAALLILYFLAVVAIGFWARGMALAVPGPETVRQGAHGDVFVQVGGELLRVTPDGADVKVYDLSRLGVQRLFDFVLLGDERILLRIGPYQKGLLENIAKYLRLPNTSPVPEPAQGSGLYSCDLARMACELFSREVDMDDVHWLAHDPETQTLYVADTARHQLHKLGADGKRLATQTEGFIFPNHISVADGQLRVVDTNNRSIKHVRGRDQPFGTLLAEHDPLNGATRNGGHGFPYMLAEIGDEHWVLIMNRSMARGGLYRYAQDWRYRGRVVLPQVEDAVYVARVGDGAWVSDGNGRRVVQLDSKGAVIGELRSPEFLRRMLDNGLVRERWMTLAYGMAALFGLSLVVGIVIGIRKEAKRASPLEGVRYERVPVSLSDPAIRWIGRNPSLRRNFYLLGGLVLVMLVFMAVPLVSQIAATKKETNLLPVLLPVLFMVPAFGYMMYQLFRDRIGVLGDVLILQRGQEHRAARGKSIIYSVSHVAIDDFVMPLGNNTMPLYQTQDLVTHLNPVIQHATLVNAREMQVYQLRRVKKLHWLLAGAGLLVLVLTTVGC